MTDMSMVANDTKTQNSVFLPTKENVDYYKLYTYNEVPSFGVFKEERKLNKNHIAKLKSKLLSGEIDEPFIVVDINSLCIARGNHTEKAWEEARKEGYDKPLVVRYKDIKPDSVNIIKALTAEEKARNWQMIDFVEALRKPGNCCDFLMQVCESHPFLKNKNTYRFSYAIAAGFGKSKPYTDAIKAQKLPKMPKANWEKVPVVIDECLEIAKAMGIELKGGWIETFIATWQETREKEKSILSLTGIKAYCKATQRYLLKIGEGVYGYQDYGYWEKVFSNIFAEMKLMLKEAHMEAMVI